MDPRLAMAELAGEGSSYTDVEILSMSPGSVIVVSVTTCRSDISASTYAAVLSCCAARSLASQSLAVQQLGAVGFIIVYFAFAPTVCVSR